MTRRAFTLLETVLAMVVGILVLTAALAVMSAVRGSDAGLAVRATHQRELSDTRIAVSSALSRLRPAPNNIVRQSVPEGMTDDEVEAIFDQAFPAPIEGLPHHFELTGESGRPRLEIVVDRLPQGTHRPDDAEATAEGDIPTSAFGFNDLLGYRGAFELRPSQEITAYELWWVPLAPRSVPAGAVFDDTTLPDPRLLCAHVAELRWSAFIDRTKLGEIRAIEARQLPAYIELELTTTEGLYASWMFELGWIPGTELASPDQVIADPIDPEREFEPETEFEFELELSPEPGS